VKLEPLIRALDRYDLDEIEAILNRYAAVLPPRDLVFVVVDGRSPGYSAGVTMTGLAQIMKDLGATTAYNIDGGGSSTMYFNGSLVNNPLGENKERGTSDILYIARS